MEAGICVDCLKKWRFEFVSEIEDVPSSYEKGKIDLFDELIEILEEENKKIQKK